jgi:hypothetical protein
MGNQVLERNERIELGKARSKEIDLGELVGQSVELTKNSQKDLHGPCPICGDAGHDFHVSDSYFWAYCCNQEGDLLTYLQLTQKCSFVDACLHVAGGALPVATYRQAEDRTARKGQHPSWLENAQRKLHKAQALLNDDAGAAGRAYLEGRGLHPATCAAFGLGLANVGLPGTWDETTRTHTHPLQPAVVIPWFAQGGQRLVGLRYRFLQAHTYSLADGKEQTAKQSAQWGSDFTRRLFGGQVLPEFVFMPATEPSAERGRTLLICEGEINCMSIYQIAHETRLDVLSIGSEAGALPNRFEAWAGRYGQILTWLDDPALVAKVALKLQGAHAIDSKSMGGNDANDLLQQGLLGAFLATVRFQFCRDEAERRALLWDLADSTYVDDGTAQVIERIRAGLVT